MQNHNLSILKITQASYNSFKWLHNIIREKFYSFKIHTHTRARARIYVALDHSKKATVRVKVSQEGDLATSSIIELCADYRQCEGYEADPRGCLWTSQCQWLSAFWRHQRCNFSYVNTDSDSTKHCFYLAGTGAGATHFVKKPTVTGPSGGSLMGLCCRPRTTCTLF